MFTSNLDIKNENIIGSVETPYAAPIIQAVDVGLNSPTQTHNSNPMFICGQ